MLNIKIPKIIQFVILILLIGFTACTDDNFSTDSKYTLDFSTDTLSFDTVFTSLGSATSKIMVYNHNKVALKISRISISKGSQSEFHINVDGSVKADNLFENIEIPANDSLFIFVAVTVNPNNPKSQILIQDSLEFLTNGVKQNIKLEAFGQDMVKLYNTKVINDSTLTAEKPFIVRGNLVVDTAKTLTISRGCKLYFHNNANLIVYGNLKAIGTAEEPITFRGDRLDKIKFSTPFPYNNVAGQWGGIFLLWSGGNHILDHVNINSGYVGIYFYNIDRSVLPKLEISNCKIHNSLLYGLVVQNGNVTVSNTEISNSSSYTVYLNGGKHTFVQSTIVNYFNNSNVQPASRDKKPAVMIMNLNRIAPMETVFKNCVIAGSSENEFSLASRFIDKYNGVFLNCYIRTPKALTLPQFTNAGIKWSAKNDTLFKSIRYDYEKNTYFDFTPDSVSPIRGLANKAVADQYPLDLNGNKRDDGAPDAGAYEWKPTK